MSAFKKFDPWAAVSKPMEAAPKVAKVPKHDNPASRLDVTLGGLGTLGGLAANTAKPICSLPFDDSDHIGFNQPYLIWGRITADWHDSVEFMRRICRQNHHKIQLAKVVKVAMRGSKPGERRGGRRRGTPNKATVAKAAALKAASADPTITPLQFLLGIMRDPKAPTELRVQVARAAAPLVHGKLRAGSGEGDAGTASAVGGQDGFVIDIEEAKALRNIEHRLSVLLRKRYAPSENGGPLTATEIVEETELEAMFRKRAAALVSPPGYGAADAMKDSNRLHQLNCKRLSPPSCGGGELKGADDEEEALLTARLAAYRHSPEGRDRARVLELMLKGRRLNADEQDEFDRLKAKYPEAPKDSCLAKAIALRIPEL